MKKRCISIIVVSICIVQIFGGCSKEYNAGKVNKTLTTSSSITNYISDNFEQYRGQILKETGLESEIITINNHGDNERYINFDVNDEVMIRFEINAPVIRIIKLVEQSNEEKKSKEIEIYFHEFAENDVVDITLRGNGIVSCRYKMNDLENAIPDRKVIEEGIDTTIKQYISTEEIEELISKARSIYSVFEEIADEYNESLEENS